MLIFIKTYQSIYLRSGIFTLCILPQFFKSVTNPVHPMINFLNANSLTCEIAFFFPPFLNLTLLFQIQMSELPLETSSCPSFFTRMLCTGLRSSETLKQVSDKFVAAVSFQTTGKGIKVEQDTRCEIRDDSKPAVGEARAFAYKTSAHGQGSSRGWGQAPQEEKQTFNRSLEKFLYLHVSTVKKLPQNLSTILKFQ